MTTRNRTPDLASTRFVDLNVLEDTEALALFSRIVGEERAAAEPDATAEVLVACAGLPLAIRICAARLAARRQWRIATLAGRLRNEHRRLDELSIGDLAVRASASRSATTACRPPGRGVDPARVFRLLGLWQGPSISLAAAAALRRRRRRTTSRTRSRPWSTPTCSSRPPRTGTASTTCCEVYATERAQAEEPEAARDEAVGGSCGGTWTPREAAADTVSPHRYQVPREPAAPATAPLTFAGVEEALAWYDDERANVVAATRQAAAAGLHEIAWRLPPTLFPRVQPAEQLGGLRDHAPRRGGERAQGRATGSARPGRSTSSASRWPGCGTRRPSAHLERALAIRQEFGDTLGEAQTAIALGEAHLKHARAGRGRAAVHAARGGPARADWARPRCSASR